MPNKIYPPGYKPPTVSTKPLVSAAKKKAVLNKMKAHMEAAPRGYEKKELIDFVQNELIFGGGGNIHIRDNEVAEWIDEVDEKWAWHSPVEEIEVEIEKEEQ